MTIPEALRLLRVTYKIAQLTVERLLDEGILQLFLVFPAALRLVY